VGARDVNEVTTNGTSVPESVRLQMADSGVIVVHNSLHVVKDGLAQIVSILVAHAGPQEGGDSNA
jgi:hypothetical protein